MVCKFCIYVVGINICILYDMNKQKGMQGAVHIVKSQQNHIQPIIVWEMERIGMKDQFMADRRYFLVNEWQEM